MVLICEYATVSTVFPALINCLLWQKI